MLYTLFLPALSSIGNQKRLILILKEMPIPSDLKLLEGKFGWLFSLFTYIALFLRAMQAFRSSDLLGGMNV